MRKVALIIGVEEYRDQMISRLKFARADAVALAEYLSSRCKFDDVRILADPEGPKAPDLGNIVDNLQELAQELRPDDLFLFFFSGHGIEKDGHGYLLTRDTRQALPEHGSLKLSVLEKTLSELEAGQRILLVDACRNSPQAAKGDADNRMEDAIAKDIAAAARSRSGPGTTTALLSACRAGQRAYEWPKKGHGVFTYFLLQGISSAAWINNKLEFDRLAEYTATEVRRWSSKTAGLSTSQQPWFEKFGDPVPIVLAQRAPGKKTRIKSEAIANPAEVEVEEVNVPPPHVTVEEVSAEEVSLPGLRKLVNNIHLRSLCHKVRAALEDGIICGLYEGLLCYLLGLLALKAPNHTLYGPIPDYVYEIFHEISLVNGLVFGFIAGSIYSFIYLCFIKDPYQGVLPKKFSHFNSAESWGYVASILTGLPLTVFVGTFASVIGENEKVLQVMYGLMFGLLFGGTLGFFIGIWVFGIFSILIKAILNTISIIKKRLWYLVIN